MAKQVVVIPGRGVVSDPDGQTNIDAINASGSPIASLGVDSSSLGNLFGTDFESYKQFIMENTDKNNAWSAAQAQKQNAFQERMNQIAMEFNASEAAKNRDWQEMMSNTAHQREIRDLQAAGLNPVLSASGGNGASVTSGATASGVTSSGAKGETDTSANSALAGVYSSLISAQTQLANAQLSAKTNLEIADRQAAASMYAARLAAETARNNNPMQYINAIVDTISGSGADDKTSAGRAANKVAAGVLSGFSLGSSSAYQVPMTVNDALEATKDLSVWQRLGGALSALRKKK